MELEYLIEKEEDPVMAVPPAYSWEDTVIGTTTVLPLSGYRIKCRAFEPPSGSQDPITYPQWRILSQTLTSSKPASGAITFTNIQEDLDSGEYAEAGIQDGSGYIYVRVFDLTRFFYLPAFSGENQDNFTGEIEAITGFPQTPYDPDNDVYPMDAITKFAPDERPSVTITYTLTTEYIQLSGGTSIGDQGAIEGATEVGDPQTDTVTITQTIFQPSFNWASVLFALQSRTYFANGIYH
jgi:hypothetical protein